MKRQILLFLLTFVIAQSAQAFMQQKNIPLTTALAKTQLKIVDIRREEEWQQTGIVEGSYTITFFNKNGEFNMNDFVKKLSKVVGKDETFAIICRTGHRTGIAVQYLHQAGYTNVINLKGGITEAVQNGVPLVKYNKR